MVSRDGRGKHDTRTRTHTPKSRHMLPSLLTHLKRHIWRRPPRRRSPAARRPLGRREGGRLPPQRRRRRRRRERHSPPRRVALHSSYDALGCGARGRAPACAHEARARDNNKRHLRCALHHTRRLTGIILNADRRRGRGMGRQSRTTSF